MSVPTPKIKVYNLEVVPKIDIVLLENGQTLEEEVLEAIYVLDSEHDNIEDAVQRYIALVYSDESDVLDSPCRTAFNEKPLSELRKLRCGGAYIEPLDNRIVRCIQVEIEYLYRASSFRDE